MLVVDCQLITWCHNSNVPACGNSHTTQFQHIWALESYSVGLSDWSLTICRGCWMWTNLTWFSSLHQTRCGAVRPLSAKAVHRSQSAILPWRSRPQGLSVHHCYLWQEYTPDRIERQKDRQRGRGSKVNSFMTEAVIKDQARYDVHLLRHGHQVKTYRLTLTLFILNQASELKLSLSFVTACSC